MPPDDALTPVRELGGFFDLTPLPSGAAVPAPWLGMEGLIRDPAVLESRIAAVRGALAVAGGHSAPAAIELRVAASVAQLGLVARLLAPVLAVAAYGGPVLPLSLAHCYWQPTLGGVFPLAFDDVLLAALAEDPLGSTDADPAIVAAEFADRVLLGPVAELVAAAGVYSVSPKVLWGNVASALNGARVMLAGAEPAAARRGAAIIAALLELAPVRGLAVANGAAGGRFRRRNCCLIYRIAPASRSGVCGDCVLTPA